MKYTTILLLSGIVIISSCKKSEKQNGESTWLPDVTNQNHGPLKQKEFKGDFDEIEISQAIEAEIIKSDVEKVVITAPENIINEILVDNKGGELHIHYKTGMRVMNTNNVKAKIYAKDFSKLEANSAAVVMLKDKFTQEKTDVEISSASSVSGNLEANDLQIDAGSSSTFDGKIWAVNLNIEASSAASLKISGKAKNATLTASSASDVSAKDVVAENAKADASSGSTIEISVSSKVDGQASSGGSVRAFKRGNVTTVSKEESSGGSVNIE